MTDDKMREIDAAMTEYGMRCLLRAGPVMCKHAADTLLALIRAAIAPQADAEHEAKVEDWSRRINNANNGDRPGWIDELRREAVRLMRARPTTEAGQSALERLREKVDDAASDEAISMEALHAFDRVLDWIDEEKNNG